MMNPELHIALHQPRKGAGMHIGKNMTYNYSLEIGELKQLWEVTNDPQLFSYFENFKKRSWVIETTTPSKGVNTYVQCIEKIISYDITKLANVVSEIKNLSLGTERKAVISFVEKGKSSSTKWNIAYLTSPEAAKAFVDEVTSLTVWTTKYDDFVKNLDKSATPPFRVHNICRSTKTWTAFFAEKPKK